jgi:hypothetical protein
MDATGRVAHVGVELAHETREVVVLEVLGQEVARELRRPPHDEGRPVVVPRDDVVHRRVVHQLVRLGEERRGHGPLPRSRCRRRRLAHSHSGGGLLGNHGGASHADRARVHRRAGRERERERKVVLVDSGSFRSRSMERNRRRRVVGGDGEKRDPPATRGEKKGSFRRPSGRPVPFGGWMVRAGRWDNETTRKFRCFWPVRCSGSFKARRKNMCHV